MQMRLNNPTSELPDWIEVSPAAKTLFSRMAGTPLSSKPAVSKLMGHSDPYSNPLMDELAGAGLVASVPLGALTDRADRYFMSPFGLQFLSPADRCWHVEGGRALLLARFPVTEALPLAACSVEGMGNLRSFNRYRGFAWEASALFDEGLVLIFWSGLLQKERHLREKFFQLGPDLMEVAAPGRDPWPSQMCFVVYDDWQAEVVKRAARGFGFEQQIMFCNLQNMAATPAPAPRATRGGITVPQIDAYQGNWLWEARVASSLWSGGLARRYYRQLMAVAEWPRLYLGFARDLVGEQPESRNTQRALKSLREMERPYLDAHLEKGSHRYAINHRGYHLQAMIDGVPPNRIPAAVRGPEGTGNSPVHDDGVMAFMRECIAGGLAGANGWRSWERWADSGIELDAMLRLNESPFGPGWNYVEYERTARRRARAGRKLGRYLADPRQDNLPFLFVLWDDEAERIFQLLGHENRGRPYPARMLTTTIERLARCGALGEGCWSWYGQPVRIG